MHKIEPLEKVHSVTKQVKNDSRRTRSHKNGLKQSSFIDEKEMVIKTFLFCFIHFYAINYHWLYL